MKKQHLLSGHQLCTTVGYCLQTLSNCTMLLVSKQVMNVPIGQEDMGRPCQVDCLYGRWSFLNI